MPRDRFLSLSPVPTTDNGRIIMTSCHSSPTQVKKRESFSMQSGNYNNRFNKTEARTITLGTAATESHVALSEESLSPKQKYVDSISTTNVHTGQTKRQRRVSSYLDSDYNDTTGESVQYAQDQGKVDADDIEHDEQVQEHPEQGDREDENYECPTPEDDVEPDWSAIAKHHPASTDVPIFLEARDRRRKIDEHFTTTLNGWSMKMHAEIDGIWDALVDIYQTRSERINEAEELIKNMFLSNEITRAEMQRKLDDCTREVQNLYSTLMMQICQPTVGSASASINKPSGN